MITIQELLYNRGLEKTAKVKLVRHKDSRLDIYNIYKTDKLAFLKYQNIQPKDVFKDVDYIVSFIGEEGTLARFIAVYRIINKTIKGNEFEYEMEEMEVFYDLKERVIINWGKSAISWHQWINNEKEVVQIHPGLHYKQFSDYSDFILTFTELKEIITNHSESDWKRMLSIVKGVYLISDTKTGKQYVGSAYGEEGIWGRWTKYVQTNGHGDNKTLIELITEDSKYALNFQFSILMILPRTITPDEAIKKERLFKNKLGTNSFGLNNN
ncbi:MAG: GIY-YIG nuclease family protein [Bacteroidota bacterium]